MRKSASRKSSQYVYSLITHSRLLVLALTLLLTFSPLPTLASTPIDSEIKTDRPQWYAFASYFEVYEVSPPQHFISQITKVIEKEKLSSDARINFYLLRHITTVKPIESTEELQAYENCISYMDDCLSGLLSILQSKGLLNQTLIILSSDHGEEFGEHGLFEHGNSLYLPSLHVPLLLRYPKALPSNLCIHAPVSLRDIPATICELLDLPEVDTFPGSSLRRFWKCSRSTTLSLRQAILSHLQQSPHKPTHCPLARGDVTSVIYGPYHYIHNGDDSHELYNYESDANEACDLSDARDTRSVVHALKKILA